MKAAETIFVRDGYEVAELGEIAALAGRSKGSIYAHFESKEDLFLALYQEKNAAFVERARAATSGTGFEDNVRGLRKYIISLLDEEDWCLLQLEFKLFAKRHPEARARLQTIQSQESFKDQEALLSSVFGPAGKGPAYLGRLSATAALGAVLPAILLDAEFSPVLSEKGMTKKIMGHLYDSLMESGQKA